MKNEIREKIDGLLQTFVEQYNYAIGQYDISPNNAMADLRKAIDPLCWAILDATLDKSDAENVAANKKRIYINFRNEGYGKEAYGLEKSSGDRLMGTSLIGQAINALCWQRYRKGGEKVKEDNTRMKNLMGALYTTYSLGSTGPVHYTRDDGFDIEDKFNLATAGIRLILQMLGDEVDNKSKSLVDDLPKPKSLSDNTSNVDSDWII